jgi:hypothetical protein
VDAEVHNFFHPYHACGICLFQLSGVHQVIRCYFSVAGTSPAIGGQYQVDLSAILDPFGYRPAAAALSVISVGSENQGNAWRF